jgi:hypothetical protein
VQISVVTCVPPLCWLKRTPLPPLELNKPSQAVNACDWAEEVYGAEHVAIHTSPMTEAAQGWSDNAGRWVAARTTSHLTPHTSHLTPHTSHLTPHTSHLTPHTSHLTPHTSPSSQITTRPLSSPSKVLHKRLARTAGQCTRHEAARFSAAQRAHTVAAMLGDREGWGGGGRGGIWQGVSG